jgi:integrase/recombinase XerD
LGLSIQEKEKRDAKFTRVTNKYEKRIGKEQGIPTKLKTFTARHSFVTKLMNSEKGSLSFNMESLRHSCSMAIMDYLAGFEDERSKKNSE